MKMTTNDLNSLINDYVRLLTLKNENENENEAGIASRDLKLKKECEALRIENASLAKRLDAATTTIESMMGEL